MNPYKPKSPIEQYYDSLNFTFKQTLPPSESPLDRTMRVGNSNPASHDEIKQAIEFYQK